MDSRFRACTLACITAVLTGTGAPGGDRIGQSEVDKSTVYVAVGRAMLHSGPAEDHYPTGYVHQGAALEVYHRTENHWLGVRPPAGSFSWIAAKDAYLLPGGRVIEVITDAAVSWIGTELGSAKQYRWQVQLEPGEQLAVVGEKSIRDSEGRETLWYQIAPPSGEFRWIHSKEVSSDPIAARKPLESNPTRRESDAAWNPQTASKTVGTEAAALQPKAAEASRNVRTASADQTSGIGSSGVKTASAAQPGALRDDVFSGETLSDYYDDYDYGSEAYYEGEEFIDFQDGRNRYVGEVVAPASSDPFAGWHAMDLGEDGLRFTLLNRLFGRGSHSPIHDPLKLDPFDISMAGRTGPFTHPMIGVGAVRNIDPPVANRVVRPWRDPRSLRRGRSGNGVGPLAALPITPDRSKSESDVSIAAHASDNEGSSSTNGSHRDRPDDFEGTNNGRPLTSASSFAQSERGTDINWFGIDSSENSAGSIPAQVANLDLSQLQVTLSETVSQPMQLWNLQPMYERARYYVEHGASAIERGQARLLVERIEEFAELAHKSGYHAMSNLSGTQSSSGTDHFVVTAGASLASVSSGSSRAVFNSDFQRAVGGETSYDATGWLVPVLASSPGQPSHAITDETGAILAYLSALPGMNLDRYLNQAVGVIGLRGYLPQLQAAHIQAQRIVRIR